MVRPPFDDGAVHVTAADSPPIRTLEILGALGRSGNVMLCVVAAD